MQRYSVWFFNNMPHPRPKFRHVPPQYLKFLDDSDALWVMGLASPDVRLGILKKVMEGSYAFHPDVARHRAQQGRAKQLDQRMGKRLG